MTAVGPLVRPELIFTDLAGTDRATVLASLAERTAAAGIVADAPALLAALLERERLGTTAIGHRSAIPHCKLKELDQGVLAVGLARPGVDFGAPDGQPVSIFFMVMSPADRPAEHLQVLARVSRWVRTDGHVDTLLSLGDDRAVYEFIRESL